MRRHLARSSTACVWCSSKKRRCDGGGERACSSCKARGRDCEYPVDKRTRHARANAQLQSLSLERRREDSSGNGSRCSTASAATTSPSPGGLTFNLRLGVNGQLEYRGPTSSATGDALPSDRSLSCSAAATTSTADVQLPLAEEMAEHLDLFAEWQNSCVLILPGSAIDSILDNYPPSSTNEKGRRTLMLVRAILSITSKVWSVHLLSSPERTQRSEAAFHEATHILSGIQFRKPCIEVVQTACILACSEYSRGNENSAWTFNGLVSTVGNSIGLHAGKDHSRWIASGHLTAAEAEARTIAYWAGVLIDRMLASCLGRNCVIHAADYNTPEIRVRSLSLPGVQHDESIEVGSEQYMNSVLGTFRAVIDLWKLNDAACGQIYSFKNNLALQSEDSRHAAKVLSNVQVLAKRFRAEAQDLYYKTLLPVLRPSQSGPLPHSLVLQMAYHNLLILIHRPFILPLVGEHRQQRFSNPLDTCSNDSDFTELAQYVCRHSAQEILRLVQDYRDNYTLQYANFMMAHFLTNAGTVFVSNAQSSTSCRSTLAESIEAAERALSRVGDVLKEMAQVWEVAQKAILTLKSLKSATNDSGVGEYDDDDDEVYAQGVSTDTCHDESDEAPEPFTVSAMQPFETWYLSSLA